MLARSRTFPSIVFRPIAVLFKPNWVLITLTNTLFIAKKPSEKESATIIRVLARAIKVLARAIKETCKSIKDSATLIKMLARAIKPIARAIKETCKSIKPIAMPIKLIRMLRKTNTLTNNYN